MRGEDDDYDNVSYRQKGKYVKGLMLGDNSSGRGTSQVIREHQVPVIHDSHTEGFNTGFKTGF